MKNPGQKIKSIKNPIKYFFKIFYFIKSETSDSFVNHFDGHFAYLKTLDFYFKLLILDAYLMQDCAIIIGLSYEYLTLISCRTVRLSLT